MMCLQRRGQPMVAVTDVCDECVSGEGRTDAACGKCSR